MKILVIENNEKCGKYFCNLIGLYLNSDDYEIMHVTSGKEGIECVKKEYISLVITDMRMPGVDGFDVIREVKDIDTNIPVMVLTAFPSIDETIVALKMGADNYMAKTTKPEDIVKSILRSLQSIDCSREHADSFNSASHQSYKVSFPTKKEYSRDVIQRTIGFANVSGYSRVGWSIHLALEEEIVSSEEKVICNFKKVLHLNSQCLGLLTGTVRKLRKVVTIWFSNKKAE